jgi:hypothetical protein
MNSRKKPSAPIPLIPRWKKVFKLKQKRQWLAWLRVGLWLAGFLIVGSLILEVWRGWRQSLWDGKSTFYLAVQAGETTWLVKVDQQQEEVYAGTIPGNLMVQAAHGFGEYQAKNLYQLGKQEEVGGARLVRESLAWTFGLPVKGVVRFAQGQEELRLPISLTKSLLGFGETNLTRWDRFRLWLTVSGLRQDRQEEFSFAQVPGVSQKQRPDGVTVLVVDESRLDQWLPQRYASMELVNEPYTWEVVNASAYSGLAGQVGRLLRNIGLQVVQVTEGELPQEGIFIDEDVDPAAVSFLSEFFGLPLVKGEPGAHSADIVIGVGDEFARACCTPQAE